MENNKFELLIDELILKTRQQTTKENNAIIQAFGDEIIKECKDKEEFWNKLKHIL